MIFTSKMRKALASLTSISLLLLGSSALAQPKPPGADLTLRGVELFDVQFPSKVRVGHGESARTYTQAVEIRVQVDPFLEGDAEPTLWIGDHELRGHRIVREDTVYTLAFDAFEPETLPAGGCLRVGFGSVGEAPCTFRWDPSRVVAGTPLVEAQLSTGGTPLTAPPNGIHLQCGSGIGPIGPKDYSQYHLSFYDAQDRQISVLQAGDSLGVEVSGIPSWRQVQLRLIDDAGQEWAYARLSADKAGQVPRTLLWYNTGVIGTTSRKLGYRPDPAFTTFEEAYEYWSRHEVRLEVLDDEGKLLGTHALPIRASRSEPLVYPSNRAGVLMNSMQVGTDAFFVTGSHFPAGATVLVFVVENRYGWEVGDSFQDLTGQGLSSEVDVVQLGPLETSFTLEPWRANLRSGRFDIITRVVSSTPSLPQLNSAVQTFTVGDQVSFGADTAVALFDIIGGHIVMEIAGRELNLLPWYDSSWFEFSDVFEKGQSVYGAVDPTDFPPFHTGGEYAAYFVVEAQPAAYWDGPSPALVDISGPGMTSQPEIALVKYSCINLTRTAIWPNANPPDCVSEYQVVVDFGAVPATSSGAYVFDNTYNIGTDFIDRYPERGFTVVENPATCCTYSVGQQDHYDDTLAGTDPNEAFDMTSLGFPLVRNWFTIRYPSPGAGGIGAPLPAGSDRYPVVLFLHGRHATCASGSPFNPSCPPGDRIPSHRGYDYILDALAKQGYIAISVDAYDIQPSGSTTNYEARGVLILEHLNRMRDWDVGGTDPWGGMFQGRIDMSRIAIAGHSRGGEGVVAAVEIDVAQPLTYGHNIDAVIAIAPTNQQSGSPWEVLYTPYLLLIGAADGDVSNLQGFTPWDNAYPTGSTPQFEKSLAYMHGANHNFWNTVWTPSFGWAYSSDDGSGYLGPRLTEAEQRQTGLVPITGFVLQHLGGLAPYREIFTGHLPIASMPNDQMHWSYQHPTHKVLDDFENSNVALNTLGGAALFPGSLSATEASVGTCSFHPSSNGTARISWTAAGDIYESQLPIGQRDVSAYSHLTFRVTQMHDNGVLNPINQEQNLIVRLVDGGGNYRKVLTVDFRDIPYPYQRYSSTYPCQMKSVRIPLRNFTMNNSGVDLTDIVRVEIEFPATGKIAIDDLQFTK